MVRLHPSDALKRLLENGELVWVYGPRRHDLAALASMILWLRARSSLATLRYRPRGDSARRKHDFDAGRSTRNRARRALGRRTRKLGLSTPQFKADRAPQPGSGVSSPLVQSVNYAQEAGRARGFSIRVRKHPNAMIVQKRLAMLEGAESALVLSSGMGATACAMLALLRPGDHMISSSWIYGGTRKLFMEDIVGMGIEVSFVNPLEPRAWRKALRKNTRVIFLESPVNPTCRVIELNSLQSLAHTEGIALVVDSTFASPINFRTIEHGVDVVITPPPST